MKLEIVSPNGILFTGEVDSVSFPGLAGSFDIMPYHAPMIAALGTGLIRFEDENKKYEQTIQGGFMEVRNDVISVCID